MLRVCGLDVHKDSIFVCIMEESGVLFQEKFGVLTTDLTRLLGVMTSYEVSEVGMESTSIYWMPIWRILEPYVPLKLVNPFFIKQLPGKKSDIKDAEWIATCLLKGLVKGSYVPEDIIQRLRQYDRRIHDLNKECVRKEAKLDAALQRCNIRLSNYVTDTGGKAYLKVVASIADGITDPDLLVKFVHPRTINKHGREVLRASLDGFITDVDIDVIRQLRQEIDLARKHIEECQQKMTALCREYYPAQFDNLQTIPGVRERSATAIIAELGTDMSSFETAGNLVAWAGLKPRNEESAGKIKARKITHGNKYIRQTLIECAWAASRTHGCFYNTFSYTQCIVRHKNKMKVQVAIARKLLVACWYILHDNVRYKDYSQQEKNEQDA